MDTFVLDLKGKCLLEYTNLLSPNDYANNHKKILNNFKRIQKN